jgi:hypothetical protein
MKKTNSTKPIGMSTAGAIAAAIVTGFSVGENPINTGEIIMALITDKEMATKMNWTKKTIIYTSN